MKSIDSGSPIPLYYQLKMLIVEDITSGRLSYDQRLPTEDQICEQYGISRTPVHRALSELASEGVLFRTPGRGTFINPDWVARHSAGSSIRIDVTDEGWADHIRRNAPVGTNVSVAAIGYDGMRRSLMARIAEGKAPDIALIDEVWVGDLADGGFILPLDEIDPEWIASEYEPDFVPTFVEGQRYQGRVYAIPEEINVAGVWYSREYLDLMEVDPPRSWDELTALTGVLQQHLPPGSRAIAMPGGRAADETTSYCLLSVLASNGVSLLNEGVNLDQAATVDAMRLLRSFVDSGAMTGEVVTYNWLQSPRLLGEGRAAITLGGSYESHVIAEAAGLPLDAVEERFVFTPFPGGPKGEPATVAGGMAYAILRQSRQPEKAMEMIQHIVSTEGLAARAKHRPSLPPRKSALDLMAAEAPHLGQRAALFSTAVVRPVIADYHLVSIQLQRMLENVLTGRFGPAAAVERTAEVISAITGLPIDP